MKKSLVLFIFAIGLSLSLTALLAAGVAGSEFAADGQATDAMRYVATDSDCAGFTPCYTGLQAAGDAAAAGDELRVATGTYKGVSFHKKAEETAATPSRCCYPGRAEMIC